jgi:hypothetical protein
MWDYKFYFYLQNASVGTVNYNIKIQKYKYRAWEIRPIQLTSKNIQKILENSVH